MFVNLKRFVIITICFVIFLGISALFAVKTSAATYYVASDTGDDTRTAVEAQNTATPWKTIQKAADTMVAGDTVNVKGGMSYTGKHPCDCHGPPQVAVVCIPRSGSAGNYITYQAWPGTGRPVLDSGTDGGAGFSTGECDPGTSYIIVEGFEAIGRGANYGNKAGINFEGTYINNIIIRNNIIHHHNSGINLQGMRDTGYNIEIYNNTTYNNTWYGLDLCLNPGGVTVYNNISVGNLEGFWSGRFPFTADYNLIYNNTYNYTGVTTPSPHDIGVDPQFMDPENGDFRLKSTSPAINAGITLSQVQKDIRGISRAQEGVYDMGAYEYYPQIVTINKLAKTSDPTPNITGMVSTVAGAIINSVEYKIDNGAWTTVGISPSDGIFDEQSEDYVIRILSSLTDGSHIIRVRIASDSLGTMSNSTSRSIVIGMSDAPVVTVTNPVDDENNTDTQDIEPIITPVDTDTQNNTGQNDEDKDVNDKGKDKDSNYSKLLIYCCIPLTVLVIGAIIFILLGKKKEKKKENQN